MIMGGCPYDCGEGHIIPIAPECPAFSVEQCEGCKKEFWLLHSRLKPMAYTLEEFDKRFTADHDKYTILDNRTGKPIEVDVHITDPYFD